MTDALPYVWLRVPTLSSGGVPHLIEIRSEYRFCDWGSLLHLCDVIDLVIQKDSAPTEAMLERVRQLAAEHPEWDTPAPAPLSDEP